MSIAPSSRRATAFPAWRDTRGAGAGEGDPRGRRDPARARRRARVARGARHRQSVPGDALRRRDQRGVHGVLRRARHRDQGQHDPDRRRHAQLHAARAAGRGRRIGAFNHPLLFTAGKCGAPLVTGNTLVVKPADQTPLSSLRIAELWEKRLPAGRVQRRHRRARGRRRAGRASEGREDRLHRQRGRRPRGDGRRRGDAQGADARARRQERADRLRRRGARGSRRRRRARDEFPLRHRAVVQLDVAASTCTTSIHDATLPEIVKRVAALKVGLPTERDTEMSCLTSEAQFDKTMSYIKLGVEGGARLAYGGKRPADPKLARGLLRRADRVRRRDRRHAHRARGDLRAGGEHPALDATRTIVVARVNALDVGLTASIWTHDLDRAHRLASRVEAGYIWINGASTHHVGVPFGGVKQSGIGPRGVDRGAPRLHADQERERHAATQPRRDDHRQQDRRHRQPA